ncbi:hypothetical protein [Streptomyces sp. NPDC047706]|uniref:hypothetical protein n=1 Tax=Streptomyces sp. NPDC047706 TaxID=3365486 RepID=UPI00371DE174
MSVTGARMAGVPRGPLADTPMRRLTAHGHVHRRGGPGARDAHTGAHYCAVDCPRREVSRCSSGFLPVARQLVTAVPWWENLGP